jgi:ATP-dependent RNA helicase DDX24/MAK5
LSIDASDVPSLSFDLDILNKLKTRVQLARKIDGAQRKMHKQKHDQDWLKQTAEAMDIELDSDIDGCVLLPS